MSKQPHTLRTSQRGVVSLMVTMVMMVVISLIVLGLAQVSRREQRGSLDNQLSAQAYYAAESGVNDVISLLRANGGGAAATKPSCNGTPYYTSLSPDVDAANGVKYTCVIVDATPTEQTGTLGSAPSTFTLKGDTSTPLNSVKLTWSVGDGQNGANVGLCSATVAKVNLFKKGVGNDWPCPYPVLRVDLLRVDPGAFTRSSLVNNTQTAFIVPVKAGSAMLGDPATSTIRTGTCTSANCSYTFTGLSGTATYYARISTVYYAKSSLTICGNNCTAKFVDGPVTIDVTGKAQDVLRRIRVSVDLNSGNQNGQSTGTILSGDSVCKRFGVTKTGIATGDYAGFPSCN